MCVMTINAGGMTVVIQHRVLSGVMGVGPARERVPDFAELCRHVQRRRGNIGCRAVTPEAVLLIRCAKQAHRALRVVGLVTGTAGIGADRSVTSQLGLRRYLVRGGAVGADGPSCQRVYLVRTANTRPRRIMACKANLSVRTISHQKVHR